MTVFSWLPYVGVVSQSDSYIYVLSRATVPGRIVKRLGVFVALSAVASGWSFSVAAQAIAELQVAPSTVQIEVGAREGVLVTAYDASGNVVPSTDFGWISSNIEIVRVEPDPAAPNIAYVVGVAPGAAQVSVTAGRAQAFLAVRVLASSGPSGVGQAFSLEILPNPIQLLPTEEVMLETRFLRADGQLAARGPLTWRSLRDAVAAVDQRGAVIGISDGQGVIQATGPNGIVARVVVQVANQGFAPEAARLSLSPAAAESIGVVVPGQNGRRMANRQLRWASTDEAVAVVSPAGVVTGVSAGAAEIVIQGFGQQHRLPVTVHRRVTGMEILPPHDGGPIIIPLTGSVSFEATFYDANNTPVTEAVPSWAIQDPSIASFDAATGMATGLQIGTTRLALQGPSGLGVSWEVQVVGGDITFETSRFGLSVGSAVDLAASFTDANGNVLAPATGLTWTTQSVAIATVDGSGTVSGAGWGRTQIVASASWGAADTADVFVQGSILVTKFPGGGGDIYAFDPATPTAMNQLTSGPNVEIGATYSFDGTQIAYVAAAEGGTQKIFLMDADGQNARVVTGSPDRESSPKFSPDGSQIVYESNQNIWIVNADGSNPTQLTFGEAAEDRPAISPDGRMIAYQSTTGRNSDIYVMSLDGSDQRTLVATEAHETFPAWFSDGGLAYLSAQTTGRDRTRQVMRTDLDAGEPVAVSPADLRVLNFAASGDGSMLALVVEIREDRTLYRRLYLLPLRGPNGGIPIEVPREDPSEQFFSPAFRR